MINDSQAIISIRNLSFSFGDCTILEQFSLDVYPGEFHYLLGQNATGKSTLVRLLSGHLAFQKGEIRIDRTVYRPNTLLPAHKHEIHTIHQSIGTFDNLTVFDNIYIPCMDKPLKRQYIRKAAQELIDELAIGLDLDQPLNSLSMGNKRMVELLTAFILHPKVLILDEPSNLFTEYELQLTILLLERIKNRATTILFFSYQISTLIQLAERVTVIRGGKNYITALRNEIDPLHIEGYLYGKETFTRRFPRHYQKNHDTPLLLSASHLTATAFKRKLNDVSLTVHQGEIVGITGISGAGKSLLSKAVIGDVPLQSGSVYYHPGRSLIFSVKQAAKEGIGYLPEDPAKELIPCFSAAKNITISNLDAVALGSIIHERKEEAVGNYYAENISIRSYSELKQSNYYSFGEQQKINICRLLFSSVRVIVADEPTSSVDVPSKMDLYNLFNAYVSNGNGILLFSSDFSEICGMCDRVYVLREGEVTAELVQPNITVNKITDYACNSKYLS